MGPAPPLPEAGETQGPAGPWRAERRARGGVQEAAGTAVTCRSATHRAGTADRDLSGCLQLGSFMSRFLGKNPPNARPQAQGVQAALHTQAAAPRRARPWERGRPARMARALAGVAPSTVRTPSLALRSRGRSAGPGPCPPRALPPFTPPPSRPPLHAEQSLRPRPTTCHTHADRVVDQEGSGGEAGRDGGCCPSASTVLCLGEERRWGCCGRCCL